MTTPRQSGWYDDPHDPNAQRYWDGKDWTPHRQRKPFSRQNQATPAAPTPPPSHPPNLPPPPPPMQPAQWPPPGQPPVGSPRQRPRTPIIVIALIAVLAVAGVLMYACGGGGSRAPGAGGQSPNTGAKGYKIVLNGQDITPSPDGPYGVGSLTCQNYNGGTTISFDYSPQPIVQQNHSGTKVQIDSTGQVTNVYLRDDKYHKYYQFDPQQYPTTLINPGGDAKATKSGNTFKITGHILHFDSFDFPPYSLPLEPFEFDATCP